MPPSDEPQTSGEDTARIFVPGIDRAAAGRTLWNFIWMSVFFSANHGCVVACLSLATARLGSVGAWQSGILYISYTGSSLFGATSIVKRLGPRNALMAGMGLYCIYVGCFLVATLSPVIETPAALLGAAIGGAGAGSLWTAQGSYFGRASEDHASHLQQPVQESNRRLASLFAFIYFTEEVALRSLSTLLLEVGWAWSEVFGSYTAVTLLSAALMVFVYDYPIAAPNTSSEESSQTTTTTDICSGWYEGTTAWQLLRWDPKMKYMIGLNAVFGLTSAFVNSYVNGEVVRVVTKDDNSTSVGLFNAWVSCVAAIMSLLFGRISSHVGNGPILILGAICFAAVVFPFLVIPDTKQWSVTLLTFIYTFHGCGRATFEGTLKATFADYFAYEKEGAFANIILQSGLSGAVGYILPFTLLCSEESHYCVRYNNGTLHNVVFFELVITLLAAAAIMGYLVAASLHRAEVSARNTSPEYIRMSQLNGQAAGH
jgi:MFS family permease